MTPPTEKVENGTVEHKRTGPNKKSPRIAGVYLLVLVCTAILIGLCIMLTFRMISRTAESRAAYERYKICCDADEELIDASDYLTSQARLFVLTGKREYMDNYVTELIETRRRDEALATLQANATSERAKEELTHALEESNRLATTEEYAMRLTAEAYGVSDLPDTVATVRLSPGDEALDANAKSERARTLVLGRDYEREKSDITTSSRRNSSVLLEDLDREQSEVEGRTSALITTLIILGVLLMVVLAVGTVSTYSLVTRPMKIHENDLEEGRHLEYVGCLEIQRVAEAYNRLLDKELAKAERLKHDAETDALTGLLNRGSYDRVVEGLEGDFALVLADIDRFKQVNDQYGHEMGDEVLRAVAREIQSHFRSTDYAFRLGGDEFAVILPGMTGGNRDTISTKLAGIGWALETDVYELPPTTLSFGVAFADASGSQVFSDADQALYKSKGAGRNTVTFCDKSAQA